MKRVRFHSATITERERQIINALIDVKASAAMSLFGVAQAAAGYTDEQSRAILESVKEFGETHFPDVKFWIE